MFETLYIGEEEVTSHADIEDEGQTVTFVEGPKIGTTATVDGQHTAAPSGQVTIVDEVAYSGLTPGETYSISGILMDKATGEPLLVDGAEITSEVEFTPESASGTVELTYTLDASSLAGTTIVVFETVYSDEVEIAAHTDINDEAQTVEITEPEKPTLGTTATVDGSHIADPTGEITIVDVVEYTGLIPGETYTISGVLMDKAMNQPLLVDDAEVTAEVEFTPESADGTVELTYTLDASTLAGTTIVVFETLYSDGVEIAAHADINDENQTVEITEPEKPTLGTTATVDGQHTADPTGEITIMDVVEYTGLTPGETYTVSGVLMDKSINQPLLVDGAEVTAEVEFTPESADGTVELTYNLDASTLAGTTIVVFETLYSDSVEIAAHADINDEAQTITIEPRGGLLIQKISEDGVLKGFTFLVEGEGYSETFITDGAGKIYIEDLAPGEYTITEQESDLTARYEIPAGQTVTVTADEATTVEFYNQLLRGKITGHKTGAEQAPLEGVTFGLFDAEVIEFSAENAIATTETDSNGEFSFEAPYGDYQVKELETVPGYVTLKESIAVELDKTDVDLEDIANSQTVVHFSKVDAEAGEELPGAVLELYAPDGSLLDTWETSDIPHVIPGLPVGEGYILREVTAPEGFEVAEDVTFIVEDTTEIQTITMKDEHTPEEPEEPDEPQTPEEPDEPTPDIPQTGGSRAVIWVSGLLILALLGLCITVPLLRHINKQLFRSHGKKKAFWTEEYLEARCVMYGDQATPPDLPLAVRLMRELADENPLAAHDLGVLLLKGMGCQADEDEAQHWFQKAMTRFQKAASTEKKPAYFQYRVGKMYAMGYGVEQDSLEAALWYERAVQHNSYPFAAYALGCLYLRGQGVERDEGRALELFLTAAEHEKQPNAYAMYELGKIFRKGVGTEIDETKADYWDEMAYNAFVSIEKARPDDKLQYRLGYMALHGIGTDPSPETAYQYWKKAVPLKNKDVLYALGKLCLDPSFSGFSPQEGERYLWESWSKHKNLQAAYLLGKAYAQGTVLPRNMEKALELLNTVAEKGVAEKGNPYAQYLLGKIYYWGNGVEQDREKGLEYIRQAEEQGHPGAVGFLERLAQWESQRIHEQAVPLFPLATRLLRQVGQIFANQFSLYTPITRLVDKKLRQKIAEKKLAHGQKLEM